MRDIVKGYGKDIGIDFEVAYLDEETIQKEVQVQLIRMRMEKF